jgi:hypothetical protein
MVDRDSPEVSVVAAAPSAHGANRHGLETHTPFRVIVRLASSFSSLLAWMRILPTCMTMSAQVCGSVLCLVV